MKVVEPYQCCMMLEGAIWELFFEGCRGVVRLPIATHEPANTKTCKPFSWFFLLSLVAFATASTCPHGFRQKGGPLSLGGPLATKK